MCNVRRSQPRSEPFAGVARTTPIGLLPVWRLLAKRADVSMGSTRTLVVTSAVFPGVFESGGVLLLSHRGGGCSRFPRGSLRKKQCLQMVATECVAPRALQGLSPGLFGRGAAIVHAKRRVEGTRHRWNFDVFLRAGTRGASVHGVVASASVARGLNTSCGNRREATPDARVNALACVDPCQRFRSQQMVCRSPDKISLFVQELYLQDFLKFVR